MVKSRSFGQTQDDGQHQTHQGLYRRLCYQGYCRTVDIADYFGVETGNNVNKIEKAACHVHKSHHVNAPIIEEFPVTLECECTSYDDNTGILVGKIVAQQADESVLTDGKIDYDKLQPIIFDIATMTYRLIGPVVGQAFHDGLKLKG